MKTTIHGQSATITAQEIEVNEKPIRRRGKHKGSRVIAKKKVIVRMDRQNPQNCPSETYPPKGTRVSGDQAVVETRMVVNKKPKTVNGRMKVRVDRGFDAEVTGNRVIAWLRRSRRCP